MTFIAVRKGLEIGSGSVFVFVNEKLYIKNQVTNELIPYNTEYV